MDLDYAPNSVTPHAPDHGLLQRWTSDGRMPGGGCFVREGTQSRYPNGNGVPRASRRNQAMRSSRLIGAVALVVALLHGLAVPLDALAAPGQPIVLPGDQSAGDPDASTGTIVQPQTGPRSLPRLLILPPVIGLVPLVFLSPSDAFVRVHTTRTTAARRMNGRGAQR
jgi:hypothetical protein